MGYLGEGIMTDDQREARILSWHMHDRDTPCGQCVVPIDKLQEIINAYEEMGFECKVTEYTPKGNCA